MTKPTPDELKKWTTSRLLACFVAVHIPGPNGLPHWGADLRKLYAAEIDRRMPVPPEGR